MKIFLQILSFCILINFHSVNPFAQENKEHGLYLENDDVVCSSQELEKFAEKMRTISILDYESEKGACGVLGEIILVYFKYVVGEDIHHESNKIEYINNYYYIEIARHKNYDLYDRYSAFRNVIPDDNFIGNLIQLTALRNHLYQPRVKLHKYRSYAANMLRILYFLNRYSYDLYGANFIKILGSKPIDRVDLMQQIRFKVSDQRVGGFDGSSVLAVG